MHACASSIECTSRRHVSSVQITSMSMRIIIRAGKNLSRGRANKKIEFASVSERESGWVINSIHTRVYVRRKTFGINKS